MAKKINHSGYHQKENRIRKQIFHPFTKPWCCQVTQPEICQVDTIRRTWIHSFGNILTLLDPFSFYSVLSSSTLKNCFVFRAISPPTSVIKIFKYNKCWKNNVRICTYSPPRFNSFFPVPYEIKFWIWYF